jgi:hypothetical protein
MRPSESSTVERVTAAIRPNAMLLLTSQFDEHKVPITGDALDAAAAGLLDGTDRGALLLAGQDSSAVCVAALTFTWSLEHGGGPGLRPRGAAAYVAGRTREPLGAVAADVTVAGATRYRESVDGDDGRYGGG